MRGGCCCRCGYKSFASVVPFWRYSTTTFRRRWPADQNDNETSHRRMKSFVFNVRTKYYGGISFSSEVRDSIFNLEKQFFIRCFLTIVEAFRSSYTSIRVIFRGVGDVLRELLVSSNVVAKRSNLQKLFREELEDLRLGVGEGDAAVPSQSYQSTASPSIMQRRGSRTYQARKPYLGLMHELHTTRLSNCHPSASCDGGGSKSGSKFRVGRLRLVTIDDHGQEGNGGSVRIGDGYGGTRWLLQLLVFRLSGPIDVHCIRSN